MRAKLGLVSEDEADLKSRPGISHRHGEQQSRYTLAFRYLADAVLGDDVPIRALFTDASDYDLWSGHWRARLARDACARGLGPSHAAGQSRVHSATILEEESLSAAVERADYAPFEVLLHILARPFDDYNRSLPLRRTGTREGKGATRHSAVR